MSEARNLIMQRFKEGLIIVPLLEGYGEMKLSNFITQPADGILYDLGLLEETCDLDTVDGIRRFAIAKTIRALVDKKEKRVCQSWMTLDEDEINRLTPDNWEHYKNGGCLCSAYGSSECCCGSWDRKDKNDN